jgi:sterol 3beta-glucosyltransferase
MTYVMFDQVFWRATAGQINRWRRNVLHLGSTSLDKMEPHKIPFLYNFSPQVVPPPLDWPEWIRVTGTTSNTSVLDELTHSLSRLLVLG